MIKVLLVGIGGYGENYLKEMLENPTLTPYLVGIADPFAFKSPMMARVKELGVSVYSSPEEFYLKGGIADLVVISSPIHTHYSYVLLALEHQSAVLVEKPVVISAERMDALREAEKRSGRFVAVGYQLCYSRHVQRLKKDILSGLYGKPIRARSLRLMRRGDNYYSRNGWAGKLSCHGEYIFDSPLSNACAHQLENMLFLLGGENDGACDVVSVSGVLYKARPDIENFDAAALRMTTDTGVDLYYYIAHPVDSAKVGPISTYEFTAGTVEEENDIFVGKLKDGSKIEYHPDSDEKKMQKLYDAIEAVEHGTKLPCTLRTAVGHMNAVIMAEHLPVYLRYDAERKRINDDGYYSIRGLEDEYLSAYREWSLPDLYPEGNNEGGEE